MHYEGDLDLFPHRYTRLANADLRQVAKTLAKHTEADIHVEQEGVYDWWAE